MNSPRRINGVAPRFAALCLFGLFCVLVFSTGCVISPRRTLGGSATPTPTPTTSPTPTPSPTPSPTPTPTATPTPTPAATGKLYVSNNDTTSTNTNANSIVRFDNAFTVTGNAVPSAEIVGTLTTLSQPEYLFLDETADRLYVANFGADSILIFDGISTKTGNVAPTRTITGPTTTLFQPVQAFLDSTRDLLYVASDLDILVFASASAATTNGDIAPARSIQPGIVASSIFVDATGDRLFAADSTGNQILVFDNASALNGTATATRIISGATTGLNKPSSVFVDQAGNLIVANAGNGSITVYAKAASAVGSQAPSATISGASTTLTSAAQTIVNPLSAAGELYVADPAVGHVAIFDGYTAANGALAPVRNIQGPATTLTPPTLAPPAKATTARGVALDTTR
jgi:hypothetical protein